MTQLKTLKIPFADWITTHEARGFLFMEYKEEWVDVKGYEGYYKVSNYGFVKGVERTIKRGGRKIVLKESILKTKYRGKYRQIVTSKNNIIKMQYVHVLVAIAFLSHKPCGMKIVVDHKKHRDLLNDAVDNLRLTDCRDNCTKDLDKTKTSSKYIGVSKRGKKWISYISVNRKRKHLGYFENEIDASNAYQEALSKLN